jgi:copper chaperone CopZ
MDCPSCEAPIILVLKSLKGVMDVEVSFKNSSASVRYNPEMIKENDIVKAIRTIGYKVSKQ